MKSYLDLLFKGEFAKADKLMQSMIPDKLYKFVSLSDDATRNEKRFKCLENNTFFFAPIIKENDPYEFKGIYLAEEELIRLGCPEDKANHILSVYDPASWYSIACLTENDEHCLPMWAYYTNRYNGFCIEYSVDDPSRIYRVLYEGNRVSGAPAISQLIQAYEEEKEKEAEYLLKLLKVTLYLKHLSWDWEKEYRILWELDDKTVTSGSYVELSRIGLRTSRVIAGINCMPEYQERLRAICRDHSFAYNRSFISKTSFGVEVD